MPFEVAAAIGYALFLAASSWGLARLGGRAGRGGGAGDADAHLEAARFHRGIAGIVLAVAALVLVVAAVRHPRVPSLAALGTTALAIAWTGRRILAPRCLPRRRPQAAGGGSEAGLPAPRRTA